MTETGYNVSPPNANRVMLVYLKNEAQELIPSPYQVPTQGNTVYGGTHGLFSSAQDYMRFCQMILHEGTWNGSQVLSKETIALVSNNHVGELLGPAGGFGLGFGVIRDAQIHPSPRKYRSVVLGRLF